MAKYKSKARMAIEARCLICKDKSKTPLCNTCLNKYLHRKR